MERIAIIVCWGLLCGCTKEVSNPSASFNPVIPSPQLRNLPQRVKTKNYIEANLIKDILQDTPWLLGRTIKVSLRRKEDEEGFLHRACKRGRLDYVKKLIEHHADIQAKDTFGKTPLDYAKEAGYIEIVNFLENEISKKCIENK